MQQIFHEITINTKGQGLYDFTDQTVSWLNKQKINNGILNINILHTSASLIIQENADPDVLYDLKNFFDKLAPMNNKLYKHTTEGKDDMPAHIKSALTNNQITLSIKDKKLKEEFFSYSIFSGAFFSICECYCADIRFTKPEVLIPSLLLSSGF